MSSIILDLQRDGFALRTGKAMETWLGNSWRGWEAFAASWEDLPEDTHMADGGRYRRRRFGVFSVIGDQISRSPHQPHFQSRAYNRLNGGFGRSFEPVSDAVADAPLTLALIGGARPSSNPSFRAARHLRRGMSRCTSFASKQMRGKKDFQHRKGFTAMAWMGFL